MVACKGIWLDNGELELIFSNSDKNILAETLKSKNNFDEAKRRCPICKKKMDKVEFERHRNYH